MPDRQGSGSAAIFWMFVISVLLFWLPVIGPFVAGFIGGSKAGGVGNAVLAAILPGVLLGLALYFLAASISGLPIIGVIAAAGGFVLSLVHIGPLLIGAILGGRTS